MFCCLLAGIRRSVRRMEDLVNLVLDGVRDGDPLVIGLFVAVVVVAITILILAVRGTSRRHRQGILLVGLCDAGKTLLFSRLVRKTYVQTYTSIKENIGTYELEKGQKLNMIDLPGHERIRSQMLDRYKDMARGIIFVVDSLTFQKEIKDVADFLYTLLSDRVVSSNLPRVLLACNKHDQTLAKGAKVIQGQLEKEMNTVRMTKSAALKGTDDNANGNIYLGKRNKDFSFSDLAPLKIEFAECSARGDKEGTDADFGRIEAWIEHLA